MTWELSGGKDPLNLTAYEKKKKPYSHVEERD